MAAFKIQIGACLSGAVIGINMDQFGYRLLSDDLLQEYTTNQMDIHELRADVEEYNQKHFGVRFGRYVAPLLFFNAV